MADPIIFTDNDVGGAGTGEIISEAGLAKILATLSPGSHHISGMAATDGGGLVVNLSAGEAFVAGYHVTFDAAKTVTVNASEADAVWFLQLVKVSAKVTSTQFVRVLSPDKDGTDDPADSVPIFTVTTDSTSITTLNDSQRKQKGWVVGSYAGTDGNQTITTGFTPLLVIVWGDGLTDAGIIGISHLWQISSTAIGLTVDSTGATIEVTQAKRPEIQGGGFRVGHVAAQDNLSNSGNTYKFIAFRGEDIDW